MFKIRSLFTLTILFFIAIFFIQCSNRNIPDPGPYWSPEDLEKVGNEMAASIEESDFILSAKYKEEKPIWILAKQLENRSDEHIDTRDIMEEVRTKLINKKIAKFVDDQALEKILEQQSLSQSALYDQDKVPQIGKLVGANLLIRGKISNIRQTGTSKERVYYNIILNIVDIETGLIIWTNKSTISRIIPKSVFR